MSESKTFKQRKLYSDFFKNLMGVAVIEITIRPHEIELKTKKQSTSHSWDSLKKATIEKRDIRCGYPGGGVVEDKKLILEFDEKKYTINVSRIRAEFENSPEMIKELRKHIKIVEKRVK